MNVQIDNNLYQTYAKIAKNLESNKNTNKNDLLDINKDFKQTYNDERLLEIVNNTSEKLCVNFDKTMKLKLLSF